MMIATPESDNIVLLSIDIDTGRLGNSPLLKLVNQPFDVVVLLSAMIVYLK